MIRIALYQGVSPASKLIRWQTWSKWSHVAAILRDGTVIEALYKDSSEKWFPWLKGKVVHVDNLGVNHTPGTVVDIFRVECTEEQADVFESYLKSQIGVGYGYWSLARFVTRTGIIKGKKMFCSKLIGTAANECGKPVQLRFSPSKMAPVHIGISPILIPEMTIMTK